MLNIKNGKILKMRKQSSKKLKPKSMSRGSSLSNNEIYNADSESRKTQRSADISKNRKKENKLMDYYPSNNKISNNQQRGKSENIKETNSKISEEPEKSNKKKTKNLVVQMSLDGEIILTEQGDSIISEELMQTKLNELDQFVRSNSKKKNFRPKFKSLGYGIGRC